MPRPTIPASTALDSDELAEALETARANAESGAGTEVVTWLMKAASAARKQGRAARAGEIARAAAGWSNLEEDGRKTPPLRDIGDDDFQDETIVDQMSAFTLGAEPKEFGIVAPENVQVTTREQVALSEEIRRQATNAQQEKGKVRVAIHRDAKGEFSFRILSEGQTPEPGEKEGFLELESGEFSF